MKKRKYSVEKRAEIKNKLIKKLKTISKDEEFILSIINFAKHIDDRKTIINYIESGDDVSYENVILLALTLYEERNMNK